MPIESRSPYGEEGLYLQDIRAWCVERALQNRQVGVFKMESVLHDARLLEAYIAEPLPDLSAPDDGKGPETAGFEPAKDAIPCEAILKQGVRTVDSILAGLNVSTYDLARWLLLVQKYYPDLRLFDQTREILVSMKTTP